MTTQWKLLNLTLVSCLSAAAYSDGPPVRHTGGPGDDPRACGSAGCHTSSFNSGPGRVAVLFPGQMTYTPGQPQTFTVVVTDPTATYFGFQLSARLASDPTNGQAGDLKAGNGQVVLCDNGQQKFAAGCPSGSAVQFIEHSAPGTGTWQFTWTPPPTNLGDVEIYIAANAAKATGTPLGTNIYTNHYTLAAPAISQPKPSITQAGVTSAAAFSSQAGIASGTWLEIYGSNLSTATGEWGTSDFKNGIAPTTLNGVSVAINGKPAFIRYVSPGQVNVQAPDDTATGPVQVVLTNMTGATPPISVARLTTAPALLAPPSFLSGTKQYVAAQFADGSFVGRPNPAKPGDVIVIYGIGFGPVTPAVPAGTITTQANSLITKPVFRFDGVPADLLYYGLAGNFVGLYQFNVLIPSAGPGDVRLDAGTGQTLWITLANP